MGGLQMKQHIQHNAFLNVMPGMLNDAGAAGSIENMLNIIAGRPWV